MTCTSSKRAHVGAGPGADGRFHGAHLREHEDQRKNADAEAGGVVAPIDEQKQNGDQERADGGGFKERVDGQMAERDRHFHNRDEMQNRGDEKCEKRRFEEAFAAAEQDRHDVQQPDPVERRGHTEPENGHFVHLSQV